MEAPSHEEIVSKLKQLVEGYITRGEVAEWATGLVNADDLPSMEKKDWEALKFLAGAELVSPDRPYLYDIHDFESELAKLEE